MILGLAAILAPFVLLGLTLAGFTAAAVGSTWGRALFLCYAVYGLAIGMPTVAWLERGTETVLFDIPGQLLGQAARGWAVRTIGDSQSDHAAYTVPWILREPQVHVPASVLAWSAIGLVLWWWLDSVASSVRRRGAAPS